MKPVPEDDGKRINPAPGSSAGPRRAPAGCHPARAGDRVRPVDWDGAPEETPVSGDR